MGVAVQSHWFSVGSVVPWARAGVGAVATQSLTDLNYGHLGLELMVSGKNAAKALQSLLVSDIQRESRQVAMVDNLGMVAVHTGSECGPFAGHIAAGNFSCQANLMRNEEVWTAMAGRYEKRLAMRRQRKNGVSLFAESLVEALAAGQRVGGDIRGKQSAALLVVSPKLGANYWAGRLIDLRVEDHPDPIVELKRLLRLHRAYEWANKADEFLSERKFDSSLKAYEKASNYAPQIEELNFWQAVSLVESGKSRKAKGIFREVIRKNPDWLKLARMLPALKKLPKAELDELLS
jgi:uncharacterized Ntn-hydrolase superfamily protein